MEVQQKRSRLVELANKIKPIIVRVEELRESLRLNEFELEKLKRQNDKDIKELIHLMDELEVKYTFNDIEVSKHFKSKYLRIRKELFLND